MRIYSSTIWLLSASFASILVGSTITFDENNFRDGYQISQTGETVDTTIFNATGLAGRLMYWYPSKDRGGPTVQSVILAQQDSNSSIASGYNATSTTKARNLVFERQNPHGIDVDEALSFSVDYDGGTLTLSKDFLMSTLAQHGQNTLFFQFAWSDTPGSTEYSYSLPWAVVDSEAEASEVFNQATSLVTSATAIYSDASTPAVTTTSTAATSGTSSDASSSSSTTTAASSSATGSSHKGSSGGLSTGAIVGIAIGGVAALMIISVVAGCYCFRRRKNNAVHGEDGSRDVHTMQDIIAEKEARVGILDGDQPETPYSEQGSHRAIQPPLGRGLGMTGMNESGVDMGIGQAITRDGDVPVTGTPVAAAAAGGSSGEPAHTHTSSPINERTSMMSSPAPRTSNQQDRAFSPYTDHPVPRAATGAAAAAAAAQQQHEYNKHHHVVDGADLVQQEQFNDKAARTPSRAMTPDQQQHQQQPISPDGARDRDRDGASTGGGTPRMRAARFGSRSATPSGISGRYAHLVEDGMTDDEIRRLEEEERALDEAIEQAGQGGRGR